MQMISEEEKLLRRQAVKSVLGTNAMEGIFLDSRTLALMKQFEMGEIEIEQFSEAIGLHVQQMGMPIQSVIAAVEQSKVDAA